MIPNATNPMGHDNGTGAKCKWVILERSLLPTTDPPTYFTFSGTINGPGSSSIISSGDVLNLAGAYGVETGPGGYHEALFASNGGVVYNAAVFGGGIASSDPPGMDFGKFFIGAGGSALHVVLGEMGGYMRIAKGGLATDVNLVGGTAHVLPGGYASGGIVTSGEQGFWSILDVEGVVSGITIKNDVLVVRAGGVAKDTVFSGGTVLIENGGTVTAAQTALYAISGGTMTLDEYAEPTIEGGTQTIIYP